jgi:plastocyanin
MKKCIGLFILMIVLVAISGCTQQAKPVTAVTTEPTTVVTTEMPTTEITAVSTPVATITTAPTTAAETINSNVTPTATPKPIVTPSIKVTTIHIRNNTYVPSELTVLPGTGITWINDDSGVHTIKATGDHAGMFTSGDLITGAQFHYTFGENTGTFAFTDSHYPAMEGTIIVQKGEDISGAPLQNSTQS